MENFNFGQFRKHVYASINGTKSNLIQLSKSRILSKEEKEKLKLVIDAIEDLRITFKNNHIKRNENKTNITTG